MTSQKFIKALNMLTEQQDQMVKEGEFKVYKGLCMQESALLRERAKMTVNEKDQKILLIAAKEAMERALAIESYFKENDQLYCSG